ncbi:MAG: Trm112 family protein [Bacteroidota bacterium]|nr:Trm112 family protein [Bacteroidota bacterium]
MNIVSLLRCPKSGTALRLSEDHAELISREAGLAYPVHNDIPIMVASESRTL